MGIAKNISEPIPDGYQIYVSRLEIAGIHYRKDEALKFAVGNYQTIAFERDQNNKHDPNAIKIIGTSKGLIFTSSKILGYVPKEVSKQIVGSDLFSAIKPRLKRIYVSDKGFIDIQWQLIGPKETKKQYDGYLKNKPASQWQKEFFKFFGIKKNKGLTTGQAEIIIKEKQKSIETEDKAKLNEWDAYEELFDEFEDADFREIYGIKKVRLSLLMDAITQLKNEGETIHTLADDIDKVVDKIIKIKPEIERK